MTEGGGFQLQIFWVAEWESVFPQQSKCAEKIRGFEDGEVRRLEC